MIKKEDKNTQEILRIGIESDFWKVIVKALDENKKSLQNIGDSDDFLDLSADQYKLENELLKAKRKYLDKLSKLPDDLISWLENPDNSKENFDPYALPDEE